MSIENPLVTAIIPVCNHEKWVEQAIMSIVDSTYQNKRIVVVDDGSTDDSVSKIIKLSDWVDVNYNGDEPKFIKKGNIKGISILFAGFSKNYGPSTSRNYGIKTGWEGTDLFAFLDSDDWYEPSKIEKSVKIWQKFPNIIGVVYSDYTTINPYTGVQERQYKEPYSQIRLMQECIINNDSVVSKAALEKCGLYDENLRVCEDYQLWCNLSLRGFMAIHIAESLINIRVGNHSSTNSVSKEIWNQCYAQVLKNIRLNYGQFDK